MSTNVGTIRGELGGDSSRWVAMMKSGRDALAKLTGEAKQLDAGLARSERSAHQARDALGRFSKEAEQSAGAARRLGQVSKLQAAVGLYAVARALRESVGAFADFNKAATEVSAITGNLGAVGAGGVESLQEAILGLSETTEFTAKEVGAAYKFLARSGLDVNEVMAAAPATMELASAAMLDVGRAADISTNVMKGMRLEVEDLGRVNDVLVKAATSSNNSVSQLGEAFSHVGPVAASAGVSLESVSASLGALGDAGLQGERGGTALRGMITKLLAPTSEATAILDRFGISIDQSTFETEGFAGVIERLAPLAGHTGEVMKIFGQRAGPGAAVLLATGADAVRSLETDLQNAGGTAERIANAQINTLGGQINIMKSNIEGAAIAVGQSFEPALRGLIPVINSVLQGIKWLASDFLTLKFLFESESDAPTQVDIMAEKIAIQKGVVESIKQRLSTMEGDGIDNVTAGRYVELIDRLAFAEERLAQLRASGGGMVRRQVAQPPPTSPGGSGSPTTTAATEDAFSQVQIGSSLVAEMESNAANEGKTRVTLEEFERTLGSQKAQAETQIQIGSSLVAEMESRAAMEGKTRVTLEEFERQLERTSGEAERLEVAAASTAVGMLDIVSMAASGNFGAAGSALGGMAGGAIGTALGGTAGGILGEALGALLGGVLGNVIEELVTILGTLTPIFDALAIVLRALAPIFIVIGIFAEALGESIEQFAPLLHALAEPTAAVLLIFVRLAAAALTFYDMLTIATGMLFNFAGDFVSRFIQAVDEGILIPMMTAVTLLYNAVVDFNNFIVSTIRSVTGNDSFGIWLSGRSTYFNSPLSEFATSEYEIGMYGDEEQSNALRDNTTAIREFTRSLTNVPVGYRVALTEYMSERPSQIASPRKNGGVPLNVNLVSRDGNVYQQARSHNMRTRGSLFGGNWGGAGGGSN